MTTFTDLPLDLQRIIYGKKFKMESKELLVEEMVKYYNMYREMADLQVNTTKTLCACCLHLFDGSKDFGGLYGRWDLKKGIDEFCLCSKCDKKYETYEPDDDLECWDDADLPPNHSHEQDYLVIKYNPFLENQEAIEKTYNAYKILADMGIELFN